MIYIKMAPFICSFWFVEGEFVEGVCRVLVYSYGATGKRRTSRATEITANSIRIRAPETLRRNGRCVLAAKN